MTAGSYPDVTLPIGEVGKTCSRVKLETARPCLATLAFRKTAVDDMHVMDTLALEGALNP
eukprot:6283108-Amphidinium_carterae.1